MKNAELVALVKSLQQEIVTLKAAQPVRKPSDLKIVLTTENGAGPSNTIYLEPEVWEALKRFVTKVAGDQ